MNLDLEYQSESGSTWTARFDHELNITKVWLDGIDISRRIINTCRMNTLYDRFEEKYWWGLDRERMLRVMHID